ncbi:MAG: type II toxin-antitoxin system Phd/YefM family antitoxin [Thiomargarita sp.]|nr:type II toxin-antitoxin system Phd/YefM family antitoxin [Thiomargarita sp.]
MDAVTVNHATQNLNHLIGQVISNVELTIICNDKGERALLMSLDEFNSWQETLFEAKVFRQKTFASKLVI